MGIMFDPDSLKNLADITKDGAVGKHAFRVLLHIAAIMDVDNKAKVDQQKLAARLEVSGQTLYMATKALCGYGFLAKAPTGTRSKTFIVNPALAMSDLAGGEDRYEAIMTEFTAAQNTGDTDVAEETEEVEIPVFVGIPEDANA